MSKITSLTFILSAISFSVAAHAYPTVEVRAIDVVYECNGPKYPDTLTGAIRLDYGSSSGEKVHFVIGVLDSESASSYAKEFGDYNLHVNGTQLYLRKKDGDAQTDLYLGNLGDLDQVACNQYREKYVPLDMNPDLKISFKMTRGPLLPRLNIGANSRFELIRWSRDYYRNLNITSLSEGSDVRVKRFDLLGTALR